MCVTDSEELNDKMRMLRDHGMSKTRRYYHEIVGFNYRMTNLQAAIGAAQIEHINEMLEWRSKLEDQYRNAFSDVEGIILQRNNLVDRKKIAWLVSILVDESKRDEILLKLKDNGIDVRPFFVPLSEMDIYSRYANHCEKSKEISRRGLNLPTAYEVDNKMIEKIKMVIMSGI